MGLVFDESERAYARAGDRTQSPEQSVIALSIPGRDDHVLEHLLLDMNGTVAADGFILPGVAQRLAALAANLRVVVITADTHGGASRLAEELGVEVHRIKPGNEAEQKLRFAQQLGPQHCVAVGNGANDALMLRACAVGLCVLEAEGTAVEAATNADILCRSIDDALDLLLHPTRLAATLRR